MTEPEHKRLASAARWCGLMMLVLVPSAVLGIWMGLWSLLSGSALEWYPWGAVGFFLSVGGALAGQVLLGIRAVGLLRELGEALEESTRRQAHLRALVDTAADAVLTCDGEGHVLTANLAAGRMFGYAPGRLAGMPLVALLPEAPLSAVHTNTAKVLDAAAAAEGRRADGGRFPISVSLSKVRLEGKPLFLVIIHDLTALVEARRQAEEAGRARSAFLLNVSHELRTPLSEVLGLVGLLAQTGLTPQQQGLVATLSQSGESLLSTVEQLLDFSRLGLGESPPERRAMAVRQVLCEATGPLATLARARGLRFNCVADDEVPLQVQGDPHRLRAVLACLALNAVRSAASGEVTVRVARNAPGPNEGGQCLLSFTVSDTGPGPTAQDGRPGGGLGLSIATRLVSTMGGSLSLDASPRQGSMFRVVLPFGSATEAPGPLPVLVVLADAAERAALESALAGLGLSAVGASTGKAALAELLRAVVSGRPFGLVVLEEQLAGWEGSAEDWLHQARGRSDWRGGVLLLRDGEPPGGNRPAGVTAVMPRHEAPARLGELFGRNAV